MYKIHFSLILTCMMCMFYTSCEKAGIQDSIKGNAKIEYRAIDDCEECPAENCCCTIELENGTQADLILCGVWNNTSPSNPCSTSNPPSPCSAISGITSLIALNSITNPREHFCLPIGGSFRIFNNTGMEVKLILTCQADMTEPDYETITMGIDDVLYFDGDGNCLLEPCD